MRLVPDIPEWTSDGVLPPIFPGESGLSFHRSPYVVEPLDVVLRYSTTAERCAILDGWLRYRQALYDAGIETGFQWLDGSFLEDVESGQGRPPNDVDLVTFFEMPKSATQEYLFNRNPNLFDSTISKQQFQVDAYAVPLGGPADAQLVKSISYWYSMWSHRRRDLAWKGFVQVKLDSMKDEVASANLSLTRQELIR